MTAKLYICIVDDIIQRQYVFPSLSEDRINDAIDDEKGLDPAFSDVCISSLERKIIFLTEKT
jgi:hypothetical protein